MNSFIRAGALWWRPRKRTRPRPLHLELPAPRRLEGFVYWLNSESMHERRGYRWTSVHEVLERTDNLYTNQIYMRRGKPADDADTAVNTTARDVCGQVG